MATQLEKLQNEKERLEKKIEKVNEIANAKPLSVNEELRLDNDTALYTYFLTQGLFEKAGETFENIVWDTEPPHTHNKVAKKAHRALTYTVAGAAAVGIAACAIPFAIVETVWSVPYLIYDKIATEQNMKYNSRIKKAKIKVEELQTKLDEVNKQISKQNQNDLEM